MSERIESHRPTVVESHVRGQFDLVGGHGAYRENPGLPISDKNGKFGPPLGGSLPSTEARALQFQGMVFDKSTSNAQDYALASGAGRIHEQ